MLKEDLIKSNIFNNNSLDDVKSKLDVNNKKLYVSLIFSNVLSLNELNNVLSFSNDYLKKLPVDKTIDIKYTNSYISKEFLTDYLCYILDKLEEESPKFKILRNNEPIVDDNNVAFKIAYDALGFDELVERVKNELAGYNISCEVLVEKSEEDSVQAQIEEINEEITNKLKEMEEESKRSQEFNKVVTDEQKRYKNARIDNQVPIKEIPLTYEGINQYENTVGPTDFLLEGYVVKCEVKEFPNKTTGKKNNLFVMTLTDETDSIVVKKWLRTDKEVDAFKSEITPNVTVRVTGHASYDNFERAVVVNAKTIEKTGVRKEEKRTDDAVEKRVELSIHTKMSALDGIDEATDYLKTIAGWGHKAMAITDINGLYAIPDVDHDISKYPDFKPIYGVELPFIDDEAYYIAFDRRDIPLKDSTYVVFDIETTGFSQEYDRIIEIGACKIYQGGVIDTFQTFINPERPISEKIQNLTSITNEDVRGAGTIEEVLPKFLEFCKDTILVAHNAIFDVTFIYKNIERLGIDFPKLPVIDTLNLFRAGYYEKTKKFDLVALCKMFGVKQEAHHRASDDARVTGLCFISLLSDLYARGITNYGQINDLIDPNEMFKLVIPDLRVDLLAKNPVGYKNMFRVLSDSLTTHLKVEARMIKSVLDKNREGILVGSNSLYGEIFNLVYTGNYEKAHERIKYYDYVEVAPVSGYKHMINDLYDGEFTIKTIIKKIIEIADAEGVPVVATSNCYYINPKDKKYRDILINFPQLGGKFHNLYSHVIKSKDPAPDAHLRTTNEMLNEFDFLDKDLAKKIVIDNTNMIADGIEKFRAFKSEMFAPRDDQFKDSILHIPSIKEEATRIVNANVKKHYGDNPHKIVTDRVNRELTSIIASGYASVYYVSHLLVTKSLSDGYLVGSRGSVGSSFVATMMDITEVNPLKPHYKCPHCKFHTFKMTDEDIEKYGITEIEKPLQETLRSVDSGYDLPDMNCPVCGTRMAKDGHDIPFETFLGFNGDKVPDIDLNFSGEYQAKAHEYIRTVFGYDNAFRAGTVATLADKNAYGCVKKYCEDFGIELRDCEVDRLAIKLVGVRRSTGQHPGGVVAVPNYVDIFDVTPYQYPANNPDVPFRTTHYDYHKFENNLLKFDILGHDDPTIIKYLMDYVHLHQDEFSFSKPQDIPIDDKNLFRLFNSTDIIGLTPEQLGINISSYGLPELGTNFVQGMLLETLPKTFAELVKISGLSHGTDVWSNNAQDLVGGKTEYGKIEFAKVIGCRDDIMVNLLEYNLEPLKAFKIMEFVRKNNIRKGGIDQWKEYQAYMREKGVPEWYIWSCEQIKYMFPKAHAIAYVMMALRIAWFKVYKPELFYSAWLSKRAKGYDVHAFLGGPMAIRGKIEALYNKPKRTATEDDLITSLQIALEMTLRGIKFLPVDINISSATTFDIENGSLRIPFSAVDGLGESVALDIVERRNEAPFKSKEDVSKRTRLNQTLYEEFDRMHFFGNLTSDSGVQEDSSDSDSLDEGLFAL